MKEYCKIRELSCKNITSRSMFNRCPYPGRACKNFCKHYIKLKIILDFYFPLSAKHQIYKFTAFLTL